MENPTVTKLTKDARGRPEVVIVHYKAIWQELAARAAKPKEGDVDLLHSCMKVLGKEYEEFAAAAELAAGKARADAGS